MRSMISLSLASLLTSVGCDLTVTGAGPLTVGSGVTKHETREVSPFTGVQISNSFEATVTVGDKTSVALDVDDNLLALVKTEVRDGLLHVEYASGHSIKASKPQKVTIVAPRLDSIRASGASKVMVTSSEGKTLKLEAEGASKIELKEMASDSVEVKILGASNVTLSGRAKKLKLEVTGASKINAGQASFESASVELSGASSGEVTVTESIDGGLTGACSLKVRGQPKIQKLKTSGASSVSS
jgi:Putative auto-transporter adhesin, head GIN domain